MHRMGGGAGLRPEILVRKRRRRRSNPLILECLEERRLLDGGVSGPIVVGRALSQATAAAVRNHKLTISYSVYNQ